MINLIVCLEAGCEKPRFGRGVCNTHYQRLRTKERRESTVPDGTKICKKCDQGKPFTEFARHAGCADGFRPDCMACHAAYHREARRTNTRSVYWRKEIKRKYGLEPHQYDALLSEQNGRCAICQKAPEEIEDHRSVLCVDHDHETEKVRGLLCSSCNSGLGQFKDNLVLLKQAASYLLKWRD